MKPKFISCTQRQCPKYCVNEKTKSPGTAYITTVVLRDCCVNSQSFFFNLITVEIPTPSILAIFINKS